jgi:hypothetical protein
MDASLSSTCVLCFLYLLHYSSFFYSTHDKFRRFRFTGLSHDKHSVNWLQK